MVSTKLEIMVVFHDCQDVVAICTKVNKGTEFIEKDCAKKTIFSSQCQRSVGKYSSISQNCQETATICTKVKKENNFIEKYCDKRTTCAFHLNVSA